MYVHVCMVEIKKKKKSNRVIIYSAVFIIFCSTTFSAIGCLETAHGAK